MNAMTTDEEAELIGKEADEVPRIAPGEKCRGKRTERDDEGVNRFVGYCRNGAGKGTDHYGEGRCKFHGGCSTGAPEGNQNPATHALNADPNHYYQSLGPDEKVFIRRVALTIEDRLRKLGDEVDALDRVLARRVAIELHIVSKATDYIENESGLIQSNRGADRKAALLGEVRKRDRDCFIMLRELGVLEMGEQSFFQWSK